MLTCGMCGNFVDATESFGDVMVCRPCASSLLSEYANDIELTEPVSAYLTRLGYSPLEAIPEGKLQTDAPAEVTAEPVGGRECGLCDAGACWPHGTGRTASMKARSSSLGAGDDVVPVELYVCFGAECPGCSLCSRLR